MRFSTIRRDEDVLKLLKRGREPKEIAKKMIITLTQVYKAMRRLRENHRIPSQRR